MEKILVLGAYSGIAQQVLYNFAKEGPFFFLVGKDYEKLKIVGDHLKVLGANSVHLEPFDMNKLESHEELFAKSLSVMGSVDILFISYGILSKQSEVERNTNQLLENYFTNAISVVHFISKVLGYFRARNEGTIAVVTSVAGERGRKSNFYYASAKSSVDVFLQGLRHSLSNTNVSVVTIKPGVVDTPMTRELERKFLVASSKKVGKDIYDAIKSKKKLVYTPWYWRYIMLVIRNLPDFIFNKLDI
ncbi:MAG: SDR family NAD(P)-dependent oxidoreductase [Ignavibacteria bacterium]|nr:SDR family NAD(P)-dependent oxidoreductase [Ignavibacteria bacterium]